MDIEDCAAKFSSNDLKASDKSCVSCPNKTVCPRSSTRHQSAKVSVFHILAVRYERHVHACELSKYKLQHCFLHYRTRHRCYSLRSSQADGSYDVVVIGAGCVGSSIARELSKYNISVLLLEAADDVTQGATKGNSGIVHAGFDDKPGSVRAKFCWPGNQMFSKLDNELHFGYQRNGSLVLAKSEKERPVLEDLLKRGQTNGVKNLRILEREEGESQSRRAALI